jgi:methionyl aminopeptidase
MILKSKKEIEIIREGGKILAEIMEEVKKKSLLGVTTQSLNILAEKLIKEKGGTPSFKNYKGFPAALCTSVNEVIVHGIPSEYILKDGDILSLDLGVCYKGFHTDMAITFPIGCVEGETLRLIRETKKALKRGIKKTKIGNTLGDIGNTIERHVKKSGFTTVEGLCGHGIGREVHEDPQVLNEGKRGKGMPLEVGMVFCIEPMLTMGSKEITPSGDGMGIKTFDNSLSAHFEHTLALTENGVLVLTEL